MLWLIKSDEHRGLSGPGLGWVEILLVNSMSERTDRDCRSCYFRPATRAVNIAYSPDLQTYGYGFDVCDGGLARK